MMRRMVAILLFLCMWAIGNSQPTYTFGKFGAGERFKLDIYYNWQFIWLNAGWVTFEIRDTIWNEKPFYHLLSEGATNPGYDWFYKVRDRYEAIVEPQTYTPHWFRCNTLEGSFWDREEVRFNYADGIAIVATENAKRAFKIDTLKVTPTITDLISAIYICRSIDFTKIVYGQKVPVPVIVGNKIYNLHFRYLGIEPVTTRNGDTYQCRKFAVMMVDGTIFSGGEDLTAWITDDPNCAPIMMEAKIAVGSVKAFLVEMRGNRWPLKKIEVKKE